MLLLYAEQSQDLLEINGRIRIRSLDHYAFLSYEIASIRGDLNASTSNEVGRFSEIVSQAQRELDGPTVDFDYKFQKQQLKSVLSEAGHYLADSFKL